MHMSPADTQDIWGKSLHGLRCLSCAGLLELLCDTNMAKSKQVDTQQQCLIPSTVFFLVQKDKKRLYWRGCAGSRWGIITTGTQRWATHGSIQQTHISGKFVFFSTTFFSFSILEWDFLTSGRHFVIFDSSFIMIYCHDCLILNYLCYNISHILNSRVYVDQCFDICFLCLPDLLCQPLHSFSSWSPFIVRPDNRRLWLPWVCPRGWDPQLLPIWFVSRNPCRWIWARSQLPTAVAQVIMGNYSKVSQPVTISILMCACVWFPGQLWAVCCLSPGRAVQTGSTHCTVHAQRGCDGDVRTEPSPVPCCPTHRLSATDTSSFRGGRPGLETAGRQGGGVCVRGRLGCVFQVHPELQSQCDCQTSAGAWTKLPRNTIKPPKHWRKADSRAQHRRGTRWEEEEDRELILHRHEMDLVTRQEIFCSSCRIRITIVSNRILCVTLVLMFLFCWLAAEYLY